MADKTTHKQKTRARILDEAAIALRAGGTEGISVANLMKRAGLTHGGFYAHFESRDDLVAHAIDRMFEDSARLLDRFLGDAPDLAGFIDYYLSEEVVRAQDRGCALPSLSGEALRMPPAARERFEQGILRFRRTICGALERLGVDDPEGQASSVMSEIVGARLLARAVSDREAACSYLDATSEGLKRRLGLATKPS